MAGRSVTLSGAGDGVFVDFKQSDINNLFNAMERGRKELGWSLPYAVKRASWNVVEKLQTSVKIAPKKREFEADEKDKERVREQRNYERRMRARGVEPEAAKAQLWIAKSKRGNKLYFRAKGKAEANKHPFVVIGNRGLAKASFAWGMGALGKRGGKGDTTKRAQKNARRNVEVSSNLKSNDPWVEIHNRLDYIMDAFKTSGSHAVDSAMRRAASGLTKEIEKRIERSLIK